METELERIAAKARSEPTLRFTSLAHHITPDRVCRNLMRIPSRSAVGIDGQTAQAAKDSFSEWIGPMLQSVHRQGYHAPAVRRVYIPKPGKTEKRPLGVPTIADRALQRSAAEVMSAIYEQDFLPCSFGGRPRLSAHHALATLNEIIAGGKISWVLEADVKNFFGSLSHEWLLRFVEHRVGDARLINLIRRWLKAGVMEDGAIHSSDEGTPQGGSISVLLSNLYLHYVLDLWFERVVRGRLRGEARLVRYIDDFVICFQYREDAIRVETALRRRLEKFSLTLEPDKTRLVEFGRFAQRQAGKRGRTRPETLYFLGMTLYCSRNLKGNFKVGMRTEKSRLRRNVAGADAADTAFCDHGSGSRNQLDPARPLCLLRHCGKPSVIAQGLPNRGTLLAQNAAKPQPGRQASHLGDLQQDQGEMSVTATKTATSLRKAAGPRSAVNHLSKSVVRENRTPRSVGTGGGRPLPVTRCWR